MHIYANHRLTAHLSGSSAEHPLLHVCMPFGGWKILCFFLSSNKNNWRENSLPKNQLEVQTILCQFDSYPGVPTNLQPLPTGRSYSVGPRIKVPAQSEIMRAQKEDQTSYTATQFRPWCRPNQTTGPCATQPFARGKPPIQVWRDNSIEREQKEDQTAANIRLLQPYP